MFGRTSELTALDAFLTEAAAEFTVLVIEGEAGIGKTTLWRQGVRLAHERGATVLETRATEAEAALSLSGLADLLDEIDDAVVARLPEPQRETVEAALLRAPPSRT